MDTTLEDVMRYVRTKTTMNEVNEIYRGLRDRQDTLSRLATYAFHTGQAVSFTDKRGRKVTGIVQAVKQKNISIRANDGVRWNVSSTLVSPVNL